MYKLFKVIYKIYMYILYKVPLKYKIHTYINKYMFTDKILLCLHSDI